MPVLNGKYVPLSQDVVEASLPREVCTLERPQQEYASFYDINYINSGLLVALIVIVYVLLREKWSKVKNISYWVCKHYLVVALVLISSILTISLILGSIASYEKTKFTNGVLNQFYIKRYKDTPEYKEYLKSCSWKYSDSEASGTLKTSK